MLHVIGEDVAERLGVVPATFRVLVTRRPRYGCRTCEAAPIQAPAPPRIVEGSLPTEVLIAHVLVSKYDHRHPEQSPGQNAEDGDKVDEAFGGAQSGILGAAAGFQDLWKTSIFHRIAYQTSMRTALSGDATGMRSSTAVVILGSRRHQNRRRPDLWVI